jgi:hypothetical protein
MTVICSREPFHLASVLRDLARGHLAQWRFRDDSQFLGGRGDTTGISLNGPRFRSVPQVRGQIQQPQQPTDDKRQGRSESTVHVL